MTDAIDRMHGKQPTRAQERAAERAAATIYAMDLFGTAYAERADGEQFAFDCYGDRMTGGLMGVMPR